MTNKQVKILAAAVVVWAAGFLDMKSTKLCGFGSDADENKSAKSC